MLCEVIESCKEARGADGPRAWVGRDAYANETLVLFGDLFDAYMHISDKAPRPSSGCAGTLDVAQSHASARSMSPSHTLNRLRRCRW